MPAWRRDGNNLNQTEQNRLSNEVLVWTVRTTDHTAENVCLGKVGKWAPAWGRGGSQLASLGPRKGISMDAEED